MPQLDLEALVSACAGGANGANERKIACEETLVDGDRTKGRGCRLKESDRVEVPLDFPPESFCLSKDAELDWFDRNAFFERKESTKGNFNLMNLNLNGNPASNSNSLRFSSKFKSKASSIIGLPKLHKPFFTDEKKRRTCKPGNAQWFPKRGSVPKSDSLLVEPSSPKVSCMGRVKSKRDRKRKNRHQSSETTKSKEKKSKKETRQGIFKSFFAVLRFSCKRHPAVEHSASVAVSPPRRSTAATKAPTLSSLPRKSTESEPPGLGGMNRFASGRRSAEWGEGVFAAE